MSVDTSLNEESLLLGDSNLDANELDLYGDEENFGSVIEGNQKLSGEQNGVEGNGDVSLDHNIKVEQENDEDLFNAVITERSSPSGGDSALSVSAAGGGGINAGPPHITGSGTTQRKFSCYVGNLTWWTTDQDLVDILASAGINDLLDVKFYENRQNGQSKGFALVSFQSDPSVRLCMERLITRQIHGQQLVVLPYTKQSLSQFEAATRKPGERTPSSNQPQSGGGSVSGGGGSTTPLTTKSGATIPEPGKPGAPVFIGTFRIGMAPPTQPSPVVHLGGPPGISSTPPQPNFLVRAGPPPPGAVLMRAMPPPGPSPPFIIRQAPSMPSGLPPGAQLIMHPPPSRPPPSFAMPQAIRIGGPPPGTTILSHGMPPPGSHVNPNFYPTIAAAAAAGMPPSTQTAGPPTGAPSYGGGGGSLNETTPSSMLSMSEAEFEEIMNRNRTVSSSAISRAVSDASAGDFASAIETLVTAISLIRQSKVSHDDRCKILISSLQDTLRGIEAKSFGGASGGSTGGSSSHRPSKDRGGADRRSRSRDRAKRSRRDRTRSRSRSRERFDDYSPRRRRY